MISQKISVFLSSFMNFFFDIRALKQRCAHEAEIVLQSTYAPIFLVR